VSFMKLCKVVSGGQTGADIAGLMAAKSCGLETGGWMPKGCKTSEGSHRDWLITYGMQEHTGGYAERTEANVRDSDATIRLANDFYSPGEICTLRALKFFERPFLDIDMNEPRDIDDVIVWIMLHDTEVLNIAGNTERASSPIQDKVYNYLLQVFKKE